MKFRGYTIEEVVRLLEDSGDSEIDEDPEHQQEDDTLFTSSSTTSQGNNNYNKNKWHFIYYTLTSLIQARWD